MKILDSIKSYIRVPCNTREAIEDTKESVVENIVSIRRSVELIPFSIGSIMGSKVTIHNRTNVIVNVALKQLGPVYWKNRLMPNESWILTVGKFWFTLEVKLWKSDGSNNYDITDAIVPWIDATITATTIALPIAGSASAAVRTGMATRRLGAIVPTVQALTPVLKSAGMLIGRKILTANQTTGIKPWFKKFGILMGKDKKFEIVGGPIESGVILNYSSLDPRLVTDQIITTNLGVVYVFENGQLIS